LNMQPSDLFKELQESMILSKTNNQVKTHSGDTV